MTEEQKVQALELTKLFAQTAKGYDTLVVMTVLEAAMTGEIYRQDVLVGQLFEEMMDEFRSEATILLSMTMLMKAVKQAKDEKENVLTPSVCTTCGLTLDEGKKASFICPDTFHKTTMLA